MATASTLTTASTLETTTNVLADLLFHFSTFPLFHLNHMVHRSMAFAQIRCVSNGLRDVSLRQRDGIPQGASQREVRRNRGGKRAPGPVCVSSCHARLAKLHE